ncbi:hypothetical protein A4R35_00845 [Thermogemmatispora tikiterensis]|uniref:Uncharacterized protein n=1 Tax=Thermogemmatispora tikiterensis TaxID=1825093 RepID=A0A328VBA4_9CHLR|nr:hypothetical protein A4R35_00845 [Thermogemmatispora tikiterensis]
MKMCLETGGDGGRAGQPGEVGGEAQQVVIRIDADDRGGVVGGSGDLPAAGGEEGGEGKKDGPVAGGGQVEDGAGVSSSRGSGGPGEASWDERAEGG